MDVLGDLRSWPNGVSTGVSLGGGTAEKWLLAGVAVPAAPRHPDTLLPTS